MRRPSDKKDRISTAPWGRTSEVSIRLDIERWPILMVPQIDETLESWLVRFSARYGLSPRELLRALAIPVKADVAEIAFALSTPSISSLLAFRWPKKPQIVTSVTPLAGERLQRFCPLCLEEDPYWRDVWAQPRNWACPRHRVFYITKCPRCRKPPWSSNDWRGHRSDVFRCTERLDTITRSPSTPRKFCDYDLRNSETETVPATVLQAQDLGHILGRRGLYSGSFVSLGRMTVRAGQALRAFEQLAGLASRQEVKAVLEDDLNFIRYLSVASEGFSELSLGANDWHTLSDLLGPTGPVLPLGPKSTKKVVDNGPVLIAAAIKPFGAHLSKRTQLAFRVGREWPSAPIDTRAQSPQRLPDHLTTPPALPAEWIPQTLWSSPSDQHPTGGPTVERAVMSLCLLAMGRTSSWSELAFELGLPAHLRFAAANYLHGTAQLRWCSVLSELESLCSRLAESPPPINYRARRLVASTPNSLTDALRATSGRRSDRVDQFVLAEFWERYTGGSIEFAPGALGLVAGTKQHRDYLSFRRELKLEETEWYAEAARYISQDSCGAADGPLEWRPP
jgi:hypothetical protein